MLAPMHFETQGQWWSYPRMHTSHLLQWYMFLCIFILHFWQNLYKISSTFLSTGLPLKLFTMMPNFTVKLLLGSKARPLDRKVAGLSPLLHLEPLPITFKTRHLRKKSGRCQLQRTLQKWRWSKYLDEGLFTIWS